MGERLPHDTCRTQIGALELLDTHSVDWTSVRATAYLIHQQVRYEYPGAIHDLRQRLMIVPPERYGGQRRVTYTLEVAGAAYEHAETRDDYGNVILDLSVAHIAREIEFTAWIIVERDALADTVHLPASEWTAPDSPFRRPTALTMPDDTLRTVAAMLQDEGGNDLTLAARINEWVHGAMTYGYGVTDVQTPAGIALAGGTGVCQDYAHIMLALCRLCGLPARYVSGHLLGEGGTHAWVDVLLPDPDDPGQCIAHPFDPTNGCVPGLKYICVAVGRDYRDVPPTSGTYRAPHAGSLSAYKRAGLTAVEYFTESD